MGGFDVSREPTRYRIMFEELRSASAERGFDIEHVHNLVISDWAAESGVEILIGDFRLERCGATLRVGFATGHPI